MQNLLTQRANCSSCGKREPLGEWKVRQDRPGQGLKSLRWAGEVRPAGPLMVYITDQLEKFYL
jgi:hypothetical protein